MDDVVPALYRKILNDFNTSVKKDAWITAFEKRQAQKTSTQRDIQEYAGRIGKYAENALIRGLAKDNLPDGIIYWNIAKRTVEPLMRKMTDMINQAYATELSNRYRAMHLGIKPITVKFNTDRCNAIMNRLVTESMAVSRKEEGADVG
ncbi:MAG: hypothetical protein ACOX8B_08650 [Lachnospiraceae bacterium]|jgi:hypothetical protein